MPNSKYCIYILTNKSFSLYVGITNTLTERLGEHEQGLVEGFTKKYKINKLIYYEEYIYVKEAIRREKQIKGWTRKKKIDLIKSKNPKFEDLGKKYQLSQTS